MQRTFSRPTLMMVVLLAGCGVKFGGDDESSGGGGDDSSSTLGNSSAPNVTSSTSGADDTTTDIGTVDTGVPAPTVTGDETGITDGSTVTTLVMTSESFTTGEAEVPACEAMCQTALDCRLVGELEVCVGLCREKFEGVDQVCEAAHTSMLECFAGLTCEQLAQAFANDLENPCGAQQAAKADACDGPIECDTGGGGDINGTMCELELHCGADPLRQMKCDTETCVCIVDGEQVGSCPADGVCDDQFESLAEKGVSCCEFPMFDF